MPDSNASKIVVFLVHGTGARDADWTQEKSLLVSGLQAKLLPHSIEIRRTSWTGRNAHAHRWEAAERLRRELRQSIEDNPGCQHFVVGHSHGGSIACYALQDDTLRNEVTGVVCLATPFLHLRRKRLPRSLLHASLVAISIFSVVALVSAFALSPGPWKWWLVGVTVLLVGSPVAMLLLAWWRARGAGLSWKSLLEIRRNPDTYLQALSFPSWEQQQFVAVRISGDEAAGGLVASQFFVWLCRATWRVLTPVGKFIDRRRQTISAVWGFVLMGGAGAAWLGIIPGEMNDTIGGVVIVYLGISGIIGVGIGLLAYALLLLMLIMHLPIGADAMIASLDVETTVEPTPPHEALVYHVQPRDADAQVPRSLRHSEIHDNPAAIDYVGVWIRDRVNTA